MDPMKLISDQAKVHLKRISTHNFANMVADHVIQAIPVDSEIEAEKYESKEFKEYTSNMIIDLIDLHENATISEVTNLANVLYAESVEGFVPKNYVEQLSLAVRDTVEDEIELRTEKLRYAVNNNLVDEVSLESTIEDVFSDMTLSEDSRLRLETEVEFFSVEGLDFIEDAKNAVLDSMEITKEKQEVVEKVNTAIIDAKQKELDEKNKKAETIAKDAVEMEEAATEESEESVETLKLMIPVSTSKLEEFTFYSAEEYAGIISKLPLDTRSNIIDDRIATLEERVRYESNESLSGKLQELKVIVDKAQDKAVLFDTVKDDLKLGTGYGLESFDERTFLLNIISNTTDKTSNESFNIIDKLKFESKDDIIRSSVHLANLKLGLESIDDLDTKILYTKGIQYLEESIFSTEEFKANKGLINSVLALSNANLRKSVNVLATKNELNKLLATDPMNFVMDVDKVMSDLGLESDSQQLVEALVNGDDISSVSDDVFFKISSSIAGNRIENATSIESIDWKAVTNKSKVWTSLLYSFEGLNLIDVDMKNAMVDHFIQSDK